MLTVTPGASHIIIYDLVILIHSGASWLVRLLSL